MQQDIPTGKCVRLAEKLPDMARLLGVEDYPREAFRTIELAMNLWKRPMSNNQLPSDCALLSSMLMVILWRKWLVLITCSL